MPTDWLEKIHSYSRGTNQSHLTCDHGISYSAPCPQCDEEAAERLASEPVASTIPSSATTGVYTSGVSLFTGSRGCRHDGSAIVYEAHGKRLAGGTGDFVREKDAALVIDLAGFYSSRPGSSDTLILNGPPEWRALNTKHGPTPSVPVVRFQWPDGTAFPASLAFWQDVWQLLPEGKTIVCCLGGHGRTGTCLAALMVADGMEPLAAIRRVRERHCSHAVESQSQIAYIAKLGGTDPHAIPVKPSHTPIIGGDGHGYVRGSWPTTCAHGKTFTEPCAQCSGQGRVVFHRDKKKNKKKKIRGEDNP